MLAVICEPVSNLIFPVNREKTGKIAVSGWSWVSVQGMHACFERDGFDLFCTAMFAIEEFDDAEIERVEACGA